MRSGSEQGGGGDGLLAQICLRGRKIAFSNWLYTRSKEERLIQEKKRCVGEGKQFSFGYVLEGP